MTAALHVNRLETATIFKRALAYLFERAGKRYLLNLAVRKYSVVLVPHFVVFVLKHL